MRPDRVRVIARREYLTRLRTKGFWLATIALPLFVVAVGVLPGLLISRTEISQRIVVVDAAGGLGERLAAELEGTESPLGGRESAFEVALESPRPDVAAQRAALDGRVLEGEIDAWIWIDPGGLADDEVEYHAESVSNFLTQGLIADAISRAVRLHRLSSAGYDPQAIDELVRSVDLQTVRVSPEGSRAEGVEAGIILAWVLFFLLYMMLVIYGQQVMNGVIEEKTSRIVEVIVSTTRPFELMIGKLCGICLVALTQLAIWLATLVAVTLPGVVSAMAWIPEGVTIPTVPIAVLAHFILHFLFGFFLFSAGYAAIGAAFNNVQEAQQFASVLVVFLVAPIFLFWIVLNDPDATVSVVSSLVPLFTPMLMLLRIAVKTPPAWQILLGYALTAAFTWATIWFGARVYRVGILMYGKKPTLRELWRWIRYA